MSTEWILLAYQDREFSGKDIDIGVGFGGCGCAGDQVKEEWMASNNAMLIFCLCTLTLVTMLFIKLTDIYDAYG